MTLIPSTCLGQNGTDINQAIPIYFGQTISDTIDSQTRPVQVYSIVLAKGQQFKATSNSTQLEIILVNSSFQTVSAGFNSAVNNSLISTYLSTPKAFTYQVATAGTYYVIVWARATGVAYQLQVTAQGTPIGVPNPTQAGCLTGQINYISYSLQLIAADLPDTASIGGVQMCASCTVKPPAYPALVEKMERAMGLSIGVSACYDSSGNIFQLTLNHP